jgi:hypothetical protein
MLSAIRLLAASGRRRNRSLPTTVGLAACVFALSGLPATASSIQYLVTVDTTSLVGNVNAPYYVDFQLNTGGGPFANTAKINNFDFGGGSASPAGWPRRFGLVRTTQSEASRSLIASNSIK